MTSYKKLLMGIALPLVAVFYLSQTAVAESGYCTGAEVVSAGANDGGKTVLLKNTRTDCGDWPLAASRWFYLDETAGQANAMLAAALSALAMDAPVVVISKLGNSYPTNGSLRHLTILKPTP